MKIVTFANYKELLKRNDIVAYGESDHIGPYEGYVARLTTDGEQFFINGLDINFIFEQYDWVWLIELENTNI